MVSVGACNEGYLGYIAVSDDMRSLVTKQNDESDLHKSFEKVQLFKRFGGWVDCDEAQHRACHLRGQICHDLVELLEKRGLASEQRFFAHVPSVSRYIDGRQIRVATQLYRALGADIATKIAEDLSCTKSMKLNVDVCFLHAHKLMQIRANSSARNSSWLP